MTEQTIYNLVLLISARMFDSLITELNILDFRKTLGDLTKSSKVFVSKNYHAEEKDEKSISNTINCD